MIMVNDLALPDLNHMFFVNNNDRNLSTTCAKYNLSSVMTSFRCKCLLRIIFLRFYYYCYYSIGIVESIWGLTKKGTALKVSIRDHINDTGHSTSIDDFCIFDKVGNELQSVAN